MGGPVGEASDSVKVLHGICAIAGDGQSTRKRQLRHGVLKQGDAVALVVHEQDGAWRAHKKFVSRCGEGDDPAVSGTGFSSIQNRLPPSGVASKSMVPPRRSIALRAIVNPMPVPS